jgi:phosphatidate cytidylyltransferase
MLKQRVLTALILGPLIIWSVLAFEHTALAIEMGLILMLAAWEWARMAGISNQMGRVGYSFFIAGLLLLLAWLMHIRSEWLQPVLYVFSVWWAIAVLIIVRANRKQVSIIERFTPGLIVQNLLAGCLVLGGAFIAVVGMHRLTGDGSVTAKYILSLLILIWAADSAAYFTGKAFGKHKLAINVSPGKTWEGVAGAMLATVFIAYIIGVYLGQTSPASYYFIGIALISVCFSIVGDLMVSLFKRRAGVKDSSHLLPGHGGILDRIDSLMSSAPVFLLGLLVAGVK